MTRTAADTETVPVAVADDVRTVIARVRCPEHGTECGGISCCCFDKHAELGLDLAAVERLEAALPEPEDPDAELVEAMAEVLQAAHITATGFGVIDAEGLARELLAHLRREGECFDPDHQGDRWEPSLEAVMTEAGGAVLGTKQAMRNARQRLIAQHREMEQP